LDVDNNLEYFLRKDLHEYMESTAVKNNTVTSWIYFDARNLDGGWDDIVEPLPDIYYKNGSSVTEKLEGSHYFTYDHSMSKMIIDTYIATESSSDNGLTMTTFLKKAVSDCISKGSDEYFLVFTSHGGGFFGFGGDENDEFSRRRLGLASNQNIVNAINTTLSSLLGAPTKLNVLGFDSCLMSDFGALDEYRTIADYVIASEATEPGHGMY
jgi:Clostripain family